MKTKILVIKLSHTTIETKYASAERASPQEIKGQIELFKDNKILDQFLGKIPAIFLILNNHRQIIYMNQGALEFTGLDDIAPVIGKRPGELFGCIHSAEEEGGCGTAESCTYCGAVNAVLKCQKDDEPAMDDCRLLLGDDHNAFDLRIYASPLYIDNEQFSAVTIQNIENEKWRGFLEQIFFHDILNTLNGLTSTLHLMKNFGEKIDMEKSLDQVQKIANTLVDEIRSQSLLMAAEENRLQSNISKFESKDLIEEMASIFVDSPIAEKKEIIIDSDSDNMEIKSDRTLIGRILNNMVKNALEAIPSGDQIILGVEKKDNSARFWVHNSGYIPKKIQLQIFNRSFSTKGRGRGLGTYSMKLLSNLIDGNVFFETSKEKGTTFFAEFPISSKP